MKKRIVSVLLVMALLVPTVTACHDSSKDNQATKDVEATGYNPEEAAKKFDFGELSDEDKNYTIEMGYFNCEHSQAVLWTWDIRVSKVRSVQ